MRHQCHIVAGTMLLSLVANGAALAAPEAAPAAAPATTECLAKPKDETPPGGHWYYRTDRTTKRKCWFVGDASTKSAKVATTKPEQSDTPATAAKDVPPSVSNARAEMQTPNATSEDEKLQESIWPPLADNAAADTAKADASDNSASTPAGAQSTAPTQDAAPRAPAPDTHLLAQPALAGAPDLKPAADSNNTNAATAPASPTPTPAIAAASQPAPAPSPSSMPTLLAALACALGAAAILGGIVMRFSDRPRDNEVRADIRPRRREIWRDIATDEMPKSYRAMPAPTNLDDIVDASRDIDVADPDIEQLLSKVSRRRAA